MILLKDVRKYYGTAATGLSKINLRIKPGEIVGILGENGSGKTTLLKAIMGLTELTEGEVRIEGRPPAEMYQDMAFITEEGSYCPDMTPDEYGEFLSIFFERFDRTRYQRLLKFFELERYKKIKTFSSGQKAKLEVSAGFAKSARYILMDEPFLGKDIPTRRDFLKLMISSLREDETILISTHQLNEIENFIDRAVILRYGLIKLDIYMDELREQGKNLTEVMMEITGYDEKRYKALFD
ncbi:MAG: ABC transporter ATP-binding protein [Caldicoprobacterales bacterium]|jgi:ABC-2 type transport system ATP-binding protein|nr:ABC transporter ATP-binding protein [Clostridiales bacterium]